MRNSADNKTFYADLYANGADIVSEDGTEEENYSNIIYPNMKLFCHVTE